MKKQREPHVGSDSQYRPVRKLADIGKFCYLSHVFYSIICRYSDRIHRSLSTTTRRGDFGVTGKIRNFAVPKHRCASV